MKQRNRYQVVSVLGTGGMGTVFKARDTQLDRWVAIKKLNADVCHTKKFQKLFLTEARTLAKLHHANLVNVYDIFQKDNVLHLVMEYIDGLTLKHLLYKPKSSAEGIRFLRDVASGLQCAYEKGIVHRDVKLTNVLLTKSHCYKLIDFGISTAEPSGDEGEIIGTLPYMPFEQLTGDVVSCQSDMYSLGITLFEYVAGTRVGNRSLEAWAAFKKQDDVLFVEGVPDNFSHQLVTIIKRLTKTSPQARYDSYDALLDDLRCDEQDTNTQTMQRSLVAKADPSFRIIHADIFSEAADVLVCPVNPALIMVDGLAGKVVRKVGARVQADALKYLFKLPLGQSKIINGGKQWPYIAIANSVGGYFSKAAKQSNKFIEDIVYNTIEKAQALNAVSVSCPLLGTGAGKIDPKRSIEETYHAYLKFKRQHKGTVQLTVFVQDPDVFSEAKVYLDIINSC